MEQPANEPKNSWFKANRTDILFIVGIILSVIIFYGPAIFGNGFDSSDNISYLSFKTFLEQAKQNGEFPQWLPNIFCGLPNFSALMISAPRSWDFIEQIYLFGNKIFSAIFNGSEVAGVSYFYIIYGIGMYLLARTKKMSPLVSFLVAFAGIFSTFVATWVMIGHNTKIVALMAFPYAFLALEQLRKKMNVSYIGLLFLSIYVVAHSSHVQMLFYAICSFGLYVVYMFAASFAKKEEKPLRMIYIGLLIALSGGLTYLSMSDTYFSTMEYSKYSTRGSGPLVPKAEGLKQDATGGNDYEYATNWSFSPDEVKTFFVPNYYGFGKLEYKGPATSNKAVSVHTYWGQMPFTDAANYMGIFILLMGVIGLIANRKNLFVQFLAIMGLFGLFLAFGKNLPIVYDLFYYHVPSFNKFRAPTLALVLIQFALPVLAGYGFRSVYNWRENWTSESKKSLLGLIGFSGIFLVFGLIYSGIFENDYIEAVKASASGSQLPAEIHSFVYKSMISDWYSTAFIALVFSILIYMFAKNKIKELVFGIAIIALLAFDLWRVDYRAMDVPKKKPLQAHFGKLDYVDYIKKLENNVNYAYRVSDFTQSSQNSLTYYGLQTQNGYHSAKLRVFQDLLDNADNGSTSVVTNPFLWNIMGVKYIVFDKNIGLPILMQSQSTGAYLFKKSSKLCQERFMLKTL